VLVLSQNGINNIFKVKSFETVINRFAKDVKTTFKKSSPTLSATFQRFMQASQQRI
jgi:hypothetical protein